MNGLDLVVRNGTVVTAADAVRCDVGVRGGTVVALADRLPAAPREVDASGMLVLPGGVDAHCHVAEDWGDGSVMADDFLSATRSAACGGTTTMIAFANQVRGRPLHDAVEDYGRQAAGRAVIDYAFHLIVCDPTDEVLDKELPALVEDGYTSLKVFMTYDGLRLDDRQVLLVLAAARRAGALVLVHAENHDGVGWLTAGLEAAGKTAPRYHATSRPMPVEREATHRAITLAELVRVPIVIVHVSGGEAAEQIRWARRRTLPVYGETCPQYLFLDEDDLARPGFEGAKWVCSPPPRDRANQEAIWTALLDGTLQIFSSDHCPFRYADPRGKPLRGSTTPFRYIPNGVPGVETRLPLLFSAGVGTGRLTPSAFVDLTATTPARLFGLHPRKGTIAVGADADLVLWDPGREVTVTNALLHHDVDYTPYEGMRVRGWPVLTLARGEVVCRDGEFTGTAGRGRFLARQRSPVLSPGWA